MTDIEFWSDGSDPVEGMEDDKESPDLHHNKWLLPDGGELEALSEYLFSEIEAHVERPKKQRRDATERRKLMLSNIVANLAVLTAYRSPGARLIISARVKPKAEAIKRYERADQPTKAFMGVITSLEALGFIERRVGTYKATRTTVAPTDALKLYLPPEGRSVPLRMLPDKEAIELRAIVGKQGRRVLVDYVDTEETVAMREEVRTITAAINRAEVTLDGQLQPPCSVARQFLIESPNAPREFNQHGRLYGAGTFWIRLPKGQRHLLCIDGQQVAELDFSSMFVQLTYAKAGLPPPEGDPYSDIGGLPRDIAKSVVAALLCREGNMMRVPRGLRGKLDSSWTGPKLQEAVTERHRPIAHLFGLGRSFGLRLMFTESCILIRTLLRLISEGIVALPIHDALLVGREHEASCLAAMNDSALAIVGRTLPVKSKLITS